MPMTAYANPYRQTRAHLRLGRGRYSVHDRLQRERPVAVARDLGQRASERLQFPDTNKPVYTNAYRHARACRMRSRSPSPAARNSACSTRGIFGCAYYRIRECNRYARACTK